MNKGGFSWKRLIGYSGAKASLSRKIGIPLSQSGRNQKIGRIVTKGCLGTLMIIGLPVIIIFLFFY